MEISPGMELAHPRATNDPASKGAADPPVGGPVEEEVTPEQVSLGRRMRQPRTIISILIPLAIIVAFAAINGQALSKVPALIAAATRPSSSSFLVFTRASCCVCAGRSCCAAPASSREGLDRIIFLSAGQLHRR
jgi:hypothetical protein